MSVRLTDINIYKKDNIQTEEIGNVGNITSYPYHL